ncbi:MAG: hypothetical protein AB1505_07560 [Candidatus Latescibacterota bacterium]
MLTSLLFGLFLVAAVALWLLKPFRQRCPECHAVREDPSSPLCPHCGWIWDAPGDDDDAEDEPDEDPEEE